ncbi:LytTR family DNA-binding domain-containing protein [Mesonia sp. MT50]|uniref:LytTR family DNA-binding domain-containing protein n=2 Tax=Mesonia TaxID=232115 RepID=A0ABU1A4N2_9FLAO|nr:LytTR family DNA-binding domain-containing protein [Mesonia profundi]MDQ7918627.1 LytTR family DNA-binding domain-containing protein [Mesonia profundi]
MKNIKLKCVVVDDSNIQRLSIIKLVKDHSNLELVGEYNNALKAKEALRKNTIDLILLDIEMPILSGFDLLDKLQDRPEIIFITGKTQYAFKAFNYEAVDFLQKPVDKERFDVAIKKVLNIHHLKNNKTPSKDRNYIFIKSKLKNYKLFLDDVKYVEAFGDYVNIFTENQSYIVLSTMKGFEQKLPENQFMRVHKSYIINLFRVKHYDAKTIWIDDFQMPISRNRKKKLEDVLSGIITQN